MVELKAKAGKTNDLCSTVNEKVLPILKKQQGFQDEIVLVSNTDANRVLALSFWNSREDAERYQREQFSRVTEIIRSFCEGEPKAAVYDVSISTIHHITSRKAA
jgi:heme-degrading monooxygenase HmoA